MTYVSYIGVTESCGYAAGYWKALGAIPVEE
jgi:hypothetical protein